MTWDQDQVDSFIKIFNWTNFEKKNCRLNTSNATGSQKFQKLVHITCTDRAVSCQSFPISTKMRSYLVTSAMSVFLYKEIRATFVKQKSFLTHGRVTTAKSPTSCHQLLGQNDIYD